MGKPSEILSEKPPEPQPDTTVDDETEDLGVEEELDEDEEDEDLEEIDEEDEDDGDNRDREGT